MMRVVRILGEVCRFSNQFDVLVWWLLVLYRVLIKFCYFVVVIISYISTTVYRVIAK